jgi:sec-independent protein translocase protein TatC
MARQRKARDRKEATFLEHLEEFRQRLIRCAVYVALAAALTWVVRHQLMNICEAPIYRGAEMAGISNPEFKAFGPAEALVLSVQIALVAGVLLAAPFWLLEAWMFIEPALEDHERKWIVPLLPFAVLLFLSGVAFCYWMSPRAFSILLGFQKDLNVAPEFILKDYLTFFLRLLLIFGVMFELPLVIMFLSAVGLVKSAFLSKHWRIAVVLIAIVTPTPDAVTMSFLAGPMVGLYLLSIVLARFVEKGRAKREAEEAEARAEPPPALPEPDPYATYREEPPTEPTADAAPEGEATEASTEAHEAVDTPPADEPDDGPPPEAEPAEDEGGPEPENQDPM